MAIMGRKKRAVKQGWNALNKQMEEKAKREQQKFEEKNKKEITEEEHKKRLKMLKEIGILKD